MSRHYVSCKSHVNAVGSGHDAVGCGHDAVGSGYDTDGSGPKEELSKDIGFQNK